MRPEIILEAEAVLGESPAWDAKSGTLYWVDILEKRIHLHRQEEDGLIQLDKMPGCLAPCKDGTLLLAAHASTLKLDPFDQRFDIVRPTGLRGRTASMPVQVPHKHGVRVPHKHGVRDGELGASIPGRPATAISSPQGNLTVLPL